MPTLEELRAMLPDRTSSPDEVVCLSPDPTQYYDPRTQNADAAVRRIVGRGGVYSSGAAIVPRASQDGGSLGYDPFKPPRVFIDNGKLGPSMTLDISLLASEAAAAARSLVDEHMGTRPKDLAAAAQHATAVCQVLNAMAEDGLQPPPTASPQPQPQPAAQPQLPQPAMQPATRPLSSAFGSPQPSQAAPAATPPQQQQQAAQPAARQAITPPPPAPRRGSPGTVAFGIPGFGDLQANYDYVDVVSMAGGHSWLVLGWSAAGPAPFVPRNEDGAALMLVAHVVGSGEVVRVESNNMVFAYKDDEVCMLYIVDRKPYPG